MKRGSLCWINLEDTSPPEFGKTRPGLIISNTEQNFLLPTVVVIPISSQPPEIWPLRIEFQLPKGKKSYLVLPGIRQINKTRIVDEIGTLPVATLHSVDEALSLYLND